MFASLFAAPDEAERPPPAVPAGERVYAIGDVHGRVDLLEALLDRIFADHAQRPAASFRLILLGDLIDRGLASAQVIDRAIVLAGRFGDRFVALKGNHEEVFETLLAGDEAVLPLLLRIGGDATLASYGLPADIADTSDPDALVARLTKAVPAAHLAFLAAMPDSVTIGDYLFVHAGVRPGVALDRQRASDLRWIRAPFLDHDLPFGKMVVHGHSITTEPDLRANRLGIDTGAYASGRLTALALEGTNHWLLQT